MYQRFSRALAVAALVALAACSGNGSTGLTPTATLPSQPILAGNVVESCGGPVPAGYSRCFALMRTDIGAPVDPSMRVAMGRPGSTSTTPAGYGPSDLRSAYSFPSTTAGSGQTVAIVDAYDDPNAENDVNVYRSQYGIPSCTTANGCFKKVNENGVQGSYPRGNSS